MEELKPIIEKFAASGCDLDPLYKRALELLSYDQGEAVNMTFHL